MKINLPLFLGSTLVAGLIGFFVGRNMPAKGPLDSTESTEITENTRIGDLPTNSTNKDTSSNTIIADGNTPDIQPIDVDSVVVPVKPIDTNEPDEVVVNPAPPTAPNQAINPNVVLPPLQTGISDKKIGAILSEIAENLEAKRLPYISSQMQDCSGIYHQIKDSLQKRLPALKKSRQYDYPNVKKVRSSRQIANWYHENDNFIFVEDAKASRNSIRPGTVMFYGKPHKKYSNMNIQLLTDKDNNFTSNGAIMHIAVVTEVRTDEEGNVIEYTIMHGRNSRVHASRSGSKEVQSTRTTGLPPFGNWSQQWVGAANIVTAKK